MKSEDAVEVESLRDLVADLECRLSAIRRQCTDYTPSPDLKDAILEIIDGEPREEVE